jgi:aldehyde dehydrogenase (NAD+)
VDQYLPHRLVHDPRWGFNASGYGKHNGFEVIREDSRLKSVLIDYCGAAQDAFVMRVK